MIAFVDRRWSVVGQCEQAANPDHDVRVALAEATTLPEVLDILANDPDPDVALAARLRMPQPVDA